MRAGSISTVAQSPRLGRCELLIAIPSFDDHPVEGAPIGPSQGERPFDDLVVLRQRHHIFGKSILLLTGYPAATIVPRLAPAARPGFDCIERFAKIHQIGRPWCRERVDPSV